MTFKTGRQFSIGGGASLAYLGTETVGQGKRVKDPIFLIDFGNPPKRPLRESGLGIAQMFKKLMVHSLPMEGGEVLLSLESTPLSLNRLIFRHRTGYPVDDPEKYCFGLGKKLERPWSLLEHVEYVWKQTNEPVGTKYPILPKDISLLEKEQTGKERTPLGLVARDMILYQDEGQNEGEHWLPIRSEIVDQRASYGPLSTLINKEKYLDTVKFMCRGEHLSFINGHYVFNETLVIACWKRSFGELSDWGNII